MRTSTMRNSSYLTSVSELRPDSRSHDGASFSFSSSLPMLRRITSCASSGRRVMLDRWRVMGTLLDLASGPLVPALQVINTTPRNDELESMPASLIMKWSGCHVPETVVPGFRLRIHSTHQSN